MEQLAIPFEEYKIVKSNPFVEARYDWTTQMHRVIMMMIAQVRKDDTDFGTQRVHIRDLKALSATTSNTIYEDAANAARALLDQKIEIRKASGEYHGYNLMSDTHYYPNRGYIEARFNPHMKPFLLQLRERFTQYRLKQAMQLCSPYSIRFYELCSRWADIGWFDLSVEDLRKMLKLEAKYKRTADLRRYVVDQAREELKEKCDLYLSYTQVKRGRATVGFKFKVLRKARVGGQARSQPRPVGDAPRPYNDPEAGVPDSEALAFECYLNGLDEAKRAALEAKALEQLRRRISGIEAWSDKPRLAMLAEMMLELWRSQSWEEEA